MRRKIVLLGLVVCFLLLGVGASFGGTAIKQVNYDSDLYSFVMWPVGCWAIWAKNGAEKTEVIMFWPWPLDGQGGQGTNEETSADREQKEDKEIVKVKGSTANYLFQYEITLSPKEAKFVYFFETRKQLKECYPRLFFQRKWGLEGKKYEWGSTLGVPEEIGTLSPEPLTIDSPPAYFKFFDLNGRDVTLSFSEKEKVQAHTAQWHRPQDAVLIFVIYPEGMEKEKPLVPGTKGKAEFTISFSPTAH